MNPQQMRVDWTPLSPDLTSYVLDSPGSLSRGDRIGSTKTHAPAVVDPQPLASRMGFLPDAVNPRAWFENAGVTARDLPYAFVLYNGLLWIEWACVLVLCIAARPIAAVAETSFGESAQRTLKTRFETVGRVEAYCVQSANSLSESKYFRPIPDMLGLDPQNFTFALAETIFLYNLAFVVWLPLNIRLVVAYLASRRKGDQRATVPESAPKKTC